MIIWLRPRKQNTSQIFSKIMFSYEKVQKFLLVIIAKKYHEKTNHNNMLG